jgi:hypothetical protein
MVSGLAQRFNARSRHRDALTQALTLVQALGERVAEALVEEWRERQRQGGPHFIKLTLELPPPTGNA